MANPAANLFLDKLSELPHFENIQEVQTLLDQHGVSVALVQAIVDRRFAPKELICRLWADSLGRAYVDPFASLITEEAIARFPIEIAKRGGAIGLYVIDGVLTVAVSTPEDPDLLERLSQIAQMPISPVFALPRDIEDAIVIYYSSDQGLEKSLVALEKSSLFADPNLAQEKIAQLAESDSLVELVDEILHFALRERATDIHIEPQENLSRIRFRIDGRLREITTYSRTLHRTVASRLKILASLNLTEPRFPQEGQFSISVGTASAYFNLSTAATTHGEKLAVRIAASGLHRPMLTLDKMAISQSVIGSFKQLLQSPSGIIFIAGPISSGKTTTLYASLHELNKVDVNIATVEEPIELQMEGITQIQVNRTIDLKPAPLLRSLLRQDPDVIAIGELRDLETAKIAADAALTGHLVISTLHANTAPQALGRLLEMGMDPQVIASATIGVLSQCLVGRICDHCKEAYSPPQQVVARHFQSEGPTSVQFYRGHGCSECRGTGYKGRIALHELMPMSEEIRTLICEKRSLPEIAHAALKVGYKPLRYDGLKKVLLGLTTIEEVEQNTSFEWDV